MRILTYLKLMRFHKPVGIWLLWAPTAWALWIANHGKPPLKETLLFFLGVVLMRAAGCVMNDLADRNFDKEVWRTKARPLASEDLSLFSALVLLGFLLVAALIVLLCLPVVSFPWAFLALAISAFYPFCKRFFHCPQLILGIAFSLGIPMVYKASFVDFSYSFYYLLIINFLWILAYDTEYAMADREDDLRIGLKSASILFASYDRLLIGILQYTLHFLWIILALKLNFSWYFYGTWLLSAAILLYQQVLIYSREPKACLRAFSINGYYGLLMWLGLIFA